MNLIKLIAIRFIIGICIMILGFVFLVEMSGKTYVSRVDCEGPVIVEIKACKPDKSCLVFGNDQKSYRVISPSLNSNICLNQSVQ